MKGVRRVLSSKIFPQSISRANVVNPNIDNNPPQALASGANTIAKETNSYSQKVPVASQHSFTVSTISETGAN